MNEAQYIGLDVHQATISATVMDCTGKLVMESILETQAAAVLHFIHGLRGSLHVTFEECTCAAWLDDLLKPQWLSPAWFSPPAMPACVRDPWAPTGQVSRQAHPFVEGASTRRTAP